VNLILFEPDEIDRPLPGTDRRAVHLREVLRRRPGDTFDAGIINGPRGKGTLVATGPAALTLAFTWGAAPAPLEPIQLVLGLPRPQTARDILRDATTLGVAAMHFVRTEKGEAGYAHSTLWSSGEWRRQLIAGAEQAFDTRLPEVTWGRPLAEVIGCLPPGAARIALDHYAAGTGLAQHRLPPGAPPGAVLAFGPERGWSDAERSALRSAGFVLAHLGTRVLRMETAVTVAVALVKAEMGRSEERAPARLRPPTKVETRPPSAGAPLCPGA
jgi:16S rRNA (uracil1498-N3)-methyltransferase